jgi:hypothetical protein
MTRKYLAFDIETAKDIPEADFNWRPYRPLGITCAAALKSDAKEPLLWHGENKDGTPAERMSKSEAKNVVGELVKQVEKGYTLLTWNGLGFDLDILAEESGARAKCIELALNHVDMMFHIFCDRGYPVALDKAAEALKIPGKPPGMSGLLAPQLWAQGRYQEVLNYVAHDVWIALEIAHTCEERRKFQWITRKGTKNSIDLLKGWLTVREAMHLPEPDTSWMTTPIPRSAFTQWIDITCNASIQIPDVPGKDPDVSSASPESSLPPRSLPYDLKGDLLGMSLDEFKRKHQRVVQGHNETAPWCSDTRPGEDIEPLFSKAYYQQSGLVNCRLDFPFEQIQGKPSPTIAGVETKLLIYEFVDRKLFRIVILFSNNAFSEVSEALIAKYGTPVEEEAGKTFFWTNGVSTIEFKKGRLKRDPCTLVFLHNKLYKIAESRRPGPAVDL